MAAFPRPDLSQMIPYDPKVNALSGEHPVPGGTFPSPPARAIPRVSDPEEAKAAFPRPDLSQMIPYDPKVNALSGEYPVPGGTFPLPPTAPQLCTILPPSGCFRGPFVAVDLFMDVFNKIQLPNHVPLPATDNGCDTRLFDLAKSVHWFVDENNDGTCIGSKRRRTRLGGDDSEEEDLPPPPANDIYRQRQQKRLK